MHAAAVAIRERRCAAGVSTFPQSSAAARARAAEAGNHASCKEGATMLLAFEAKAERC
jgi:hypothetical protein